MDRLGRSLRFCHLQFDGEAISDVSWSSGNSSIEGGGSLIFRQFFNWAYVYVFILVAPIVYLFSPWLSNLNYILENKDDDNP